MREFQIVAQLLQQIRLHNRVATPDRKIRACSQRDRPWGRNATRGDARLPRSLDFHHHQGAIVRDGAPFGEGFNFRKQEVGKLV